MMISEVDKKIWIQLAELFFLDTEMDDLDFKNMADILNLNDWSKQKTEQVLIEYITPVAGANVGYLLWPVIGEWSGFSPDPMVRDIEKIISKRQSKPKYYFLISDWWCKNMLYKLNLKRLLNLLEK